MMPAQLVFRAVAMLADAGSQFLYFRDQLVSCK
jgi:hypothetical protein